MKTAEGRICIMSVDDPHLHAHCARTRQLFLWFHFGALVVHRVSRAAHCRFTCWFGLRRQGIYIKHELFSYDILCKIIKNACDAYKSINHWLHQAEKTQLWLNRNSPRRSFNWANEKPCNSRTRISSSNHGN